MSARLRTWLNIALALLATAALLFCGAVFAISVHLSPTWICPADSVSFNRVNGVDVVTIEGIACPADSIFHDGFGQ